MRKIKKAVSFNMLFTLITLFAALCVLSMAAVAADYEPAGG